MGVQNPQEIEISSVALDGYLRSGNIPIPPTSNTNYLFDSVYLPSTSPVSMRAYYPDVSNESKHIVQNWNNAFTGLPWIQPFWAYGANAPVLYEIVSAPAGMTIGTQLVRNPVSGYFVPDQAYANLRWDNPTAGRHHIGIRATDQFGQMVYWIFDLYVGIANHHFMSLSGSGSGVGDNPSNYASYANTIKGATTVSPSKGKVLHIKGDDYPNTSDIFIDYAYNASSLVAMPNETPIFHCKMKNTSACTSFYGLYFKDIGTADFGILGGGYTEYCNMGVWRCTFENIIKTSGTNENNSCIGFSKISNGQGRRVVFMSENTFINNTTTHGFDFYNVKDYVFTRNNLQINNGATSITTSWIFPKVQAQGEVMYNFGDIPTVTSTSDSIIQLLNAWEPNFATSYDIKARCEYNFIRTGGAVVLRSNADADSALVSLPVNTLSNYVKRNTFIGGQVYAEFYNSTTAHTLRHSYFESNVIINNLGGLTVPANSSSWFFVSGTNVNGTPAANLIDVNGHLNNSANWGKTGQDIWRPE